jgi:DNA mismatch repair ATPase MutS
VLFDEIFHSTNPPDGIKTANKFLEKLYSYKHISSIISTHVFEIIENSPDFVKKICVKAQRIGSVLHYDYKISDGICKESSVTEIWDKVYEDADQ